MTAVSALGWRESYYITRGYNESFRALVRALNLPALGIQSPVIRTLIDAKNDGTGWIETADGTLWRIEGVLTKTPCVQPVIGQGRALCAYRFRQPPNWMRDPLAPPPESLRVEGLP